MRSEEEIREAYNKILTDEPIPSSVKMGYQAALKWVLGEE